MAAAVHVKPANLKLTTDRADWADERRLTYPRESAGPASSAVHIKPASLQLTTDNADWAEERIDVSAQTRRISVIRGPYQTRQLAIDHGWRGLGR